MRGVLVLRSRLLKGSLLVDSAMLSVLLPKENLLACSVELADEGTADELAMSSNPTASISSRLENGTNEVSAKGSASLM